LLLQPRGRIARGFRGSSRKNSVLFGQFDAACSPAKELHIKFAFDGLDPLSERRLLYSNTLGGLGNVSLFRGDDEIVQVLEIHSISINVWVSI
jgi:hypothetical protein